MHTLTLHAHTVHRAPVVCPDCLGSGCKTCNQTGEDQWTRPA